MTDIPQRNSFTIDRSADSARADFTDGDGNHARVLLPSGLLGPASAELVCADGTLLRGSEAAGAPAAQALDPRSLMRALDDLAEALSPQTQRNMRERLDRSGHAEVDLGTLESPLTATCRAKGGPVVGS